MWSKLDTQDKILKQAQEDLKINEILIEEAPMEKDKETGKWRFLNATES